MKLSLKLFLIFIFLNSCKKEEFNTNIIIKLKSSIPFLKTEATPMHITRYFVDMNKEYKNVLYTLYTDSFGNYSNSIKVKKPGNKEFYKIGMEETFWLLPLTPPMAFKAGIENNIEIRILPKWKKTIHLVDSSGKYQPYNLFSFHNLSQNYSGISYHIKDFPSFSSESYIITAPSDAYVTIYLSLMNKSNNKVETRQFKYSSNSFNSLWIRF